MHIHLHRFVSDSEGTFGYMIFPDGTTMPTVERPWLNNAPNISAIPVGTYTLRKRRSPLIERLTKGKYLEGWEVTNVKGRSYIMVHIANWPNDLEGCIGVGLQHNVIPKNGVPLKAVSQSSKAYDLFVDKLEGEDYHTITISMV